MGNAAKKYMKRVLIKSWPFGCILLLWLLFSSLYFMKGLVPFPSRYLVTFFAPWNAKYAMPVKNNAMPDVISQIYPWKNVTIQSWKLGQAPLWNPYSFAGTPHAGNFQTGVFSPMNALFMVLPFLDAWSVSILLQPLLAGVFMYIFLYYIFRSRTASVIGAMGYMFSGYLVTWMAYGTIGYAYLFLPLLLFGIRRECTKSHWLNFLIIPLSIACSLSSGHSQISMYVLFAALLYTVFIGWSEKKWAIVGKVCGLMVCGVLIGAPQLLLTLKAFGESTRNIFIEKREIIPWQNLVTFLAPDFFGNPVTRNDWFGHYAEWLGYVGIVPFILSVYALIKRRNAGKIFFLLLFIVSIFFSYPTFASSLVFSLRIPFLSTSAASRIIILTSLSLVGLSGYGFCDWLEDRKRNNRSAFFITLGILSGIFILVWLIVLCMNVIPLEARIIAKRNLILPTIFAGGTLFILGLGFVKRLSKITILLPICLIALSGFDAYRFSSKWMPFDEREYVYPNIEVLTFLKEKGSINRVFGGIGNEVGSMFSIPLIEGYDAMYKRRYGQLIASSSDGVLKDAERSLVSFDKHGIYKDKILQLLGVKYIVHRISDGRNIWAFPFWEYEENMVSIFKDAYYEVFEYKQALPRTFLASSFVVNTEDQDILKTLFDQSFDLQETIVIEKEPFIEPQQGEGAAVIDKYTPNYIQIRTVSSVPKLLFLSDVYDDGWQVYVDKKKEEVLRADFTFRAVSLSAGEHTIEYVYQPKEYIYGIIVSVGSILVLTVVLFFIIKRKKDV